MLTKFVIKTSVDVTLVAAITSAVRRAAAITIDTSSIENNTLRSLTNGFLSLGDYVVDTGIGFYNSLTSKTPKKNTKKPNDP
ncbi:hypothetical protein M0811_00306 [Anaeramoeba ignava]|uniref:Uncharacterized protein n=1 Tax=Anaeramoeba ignava TaxID=1746090 RepID=A0A9Q0LNU9_ANAIG|nr:hypothetical protein M0811_00306 [Anaeramoeba ignava]